LREESLLVFCFEHGGILRFTQNDDQETFSATSEDAGYNKSRTNNRDADKAAGTLEHSHEPRSVPDVKKRLLTR